MRNLFISPQEAARELLRRRAARKNLIAFTKYTNPQYKPAAHHYKIAEKLEAVARGDILRLMIFVPPRHGKTELGSRRLPPWYLGMYPNKQIIAASYNSDLSNDFGRDVRNIVASDDYSKLFKTRLSPDSRAANRWHTQDGGMYVAAGVGTAITGRGANIALIDDPFKDAKEADSRVVRDNVWSWYQSTLYTRLMPNGAIILIQTRWHDDDLAGRLLKDNFDNWEVLEFPALSNNRALWPEWFPVEKLEHLRDKVLSPRYWNALYQQNPIPEEGDYIRAVDIQYYDAAPKHLNIYGASDYAVTEDSGDWTEHGIIGVDPNDDIYVLDWWRGQTRADEWIESELDLIKKHRPIIWFGESGVIRRSVEPFLLKRMDERRDYCRLEWLPSITDKPTRARAIQSRFAMRKVFLPHTDWSAELIRQLLRFPAGAVDDGVDVLSLFGRGLDQTWCAKAKIENPKEDAYKKPTLSQMLTRHDKNKHKKQRRRI